LAPKLGEILRRTFLAWIQQPATVKPGPTWESGCDQWFSAYPAWGVGLVLALGFVARVWVAHGTFLNPDECLHFQLANQPSFALAFRESHHTMHPPLLVLILYFWRVLGTSELVLRLPSAIAGTLFSWFTFRWLTNLFGNATGWIGLIFVTFLSSMIGLSAEVRQYALLLVFASCCLYLLERALADNSPAMMLLFSISLCLALLSHYSGALFAVAIAVYAVLRMLAEPPARGTVVVWMVGQAGALAVALFLYFTYVAKLVGGTAEASQDIHQWMRDIYLRRSFFQPGHDNPLWFMVVRTGSVFQFLFGQLAIGDLALPLFIAGLVLLARAKTAPGPTKVAPKLLALLLVLPFIVNCGAALARKYPYGGTRHSVFLAIFGLAGVSFVVARAVGQRIARGVALALIVCAFSNAFATRPPLSLKRTDQSAAHMDAAIQLLMQHAGEPIFVDYQSSLLLGHYLCRQKPLQRTWIASVFDVFECEGRRVISVHYRDWSFTPASFPLQWEEAVRTYKLPQGSGVWIFQAGWGADLVPKLQTNYAEFRELPAQSFGRNITVFKLTVGQPLPSVPVTPGPAHQEERNN